MKRKKREKKIVCKICVSSDSILCWIGTGLCSLRCYQSLESGCSTFLRNKVFLLFFKSNCSNWMCCLWLCVTLPPSLTVYCMYDVIIHDLDVLWILFQRLLFRCVLFCCYKLHMLFFIQYFIIYYWYNFCSAVYSDMSNTVTGNFSVCSMLIVYVWPCQMLYFYSSVYAGAECKLFPLFSLQPLHTFLLSFKYSFVFISVCVFVV